MKTLFEFIEKDNHLDLGNYSFSPITQISAGLALEYCKTIKKIKEYQQPFFICFPVKKRASIWTSIILLSNYFLEDYIDNETDGISFQRLDKVKIFGCIAEVERVSEDTIYLNFKDQGNIPIRGLKSQLSKVPKNRSLTKKQTFANKLRVAVHSRSTISKILIPNDNQTINQNNLDSQILLVAGRGKVKEFHDFLENTEIYDEPLSKVFSPKKNLIITPDLKNYSEAFNENREKEIDFFKLLIVQLIHSIEIQEAKEQLSEMSQKLIKENIISQEFDILFKNFHNSFSIEIPQLNFLAEKYPGYQDPLPKKLRAVVINDIQQVKDFPNTIDGFLKNCIPVIVISNRNIESAIEFEFFNNLFNSNPDYLRINWNKKKIGELIQFDSKETFLDDELWTACKRYANQEIRVSVFPSNLLDSLIPKLMKHIRELDHFENLQTAFYNYLYPAIYSVKNSKNIDNKILDIIEKFEFEFNLVKKNGLSMEDAKDFDDAIDWLKSFDTNSKQFNDSENVFTSKVQSIDSFIPNDRQYINGSDSQTERILFTGYPYNEYINKPLSKATFEHFVPRIDLLCWPIESSLTIKYLKRRFKAGYFLDNIAQLAPFEANLLIQSEDAINEEIETSFTLQKEVNEEIEQEENLEYLHTFKYKGYGNQSEQNGSFKVKCDILNFSDGNFMFLPKRSSILTLSESINGQIKIAQLKLVDIEVNSRIFKYKKDRGIYREISKTDNAIEKQFRLLENWKSILLDLFDKCDCKIGNLEDLLKTTKTLQKIENGNPNKASIQRWVFDDDIIKPDNSNLKIIFIAAKIDDIDTKLAELDFAYKAVLSYTIGLSSKIKAAIASYLENSPINSNDFSVTIKGYKIDVESRTITSKIDSEIEIDYYNTRKILC